MPTRKELTMRQIKQMLHLARDGASSREIGRTLGIARSTVQDNLTRASSAGLTCRSAPRSPTRCWSSACLPGPG